MADPGPASSPPMAATVTIHCKHGPNLYSLPVSLDSTVHDLKTSLHSLTNVLPRFQKLIFKGKVLDAKSHLRDAALTNDSKIMMIGSGGDLHNKVAESPTKLQPRTDKKDHRDVSINHNLGHGKSTGSKAGQMVPSSNIWKATGIVSLQDRNLQVVPAEVWETGATARVLDLAKNSLEIFPQNVSNLTNLKKLRIDLNHLRNDQIQWQGIAMLRQLTVLSLDYNELVCVPPEIGMLLELKHLSIAHNMLEDVSKDIGNLSKLETVNFSHNRIVDLPSSISHCTQLIQVDLSSNRLLQLPSSLGQLKRLKLLNLGCNAIHTFPSQILKGCVELCTLSLHKNNITIEELREVDGWEEFDERRKAKHFKQLDFSLFNPCPGFDEGADSEQWHHW